MGAFDCLSDETCKDEYDKKLDRHQTQIALHRKHFKDAATELFVTSVRKGVQGLTVASNVVYQWGLDLWGMANDWEVEVADYGVLPVGKVVLSTLLLVKGQLLLKLHGLSWLVVRMQEEINVFLSKKNEGGIYGTRSESTNTNGNSDMEDKDEDDMNKTDAEKAEGVGESELTEMDL